MRPNTSHRVPSKSSMRLRRRRMTNRSSKYLRRHHMAVRSSERLRHRRMPIISTNRINEIWEETVKKFVTKKFGTYDSCNYNSAIEFLENQPIIRRANSRVKNSGQSKAQYGRLKAEGFEYLMNNVLELTSNDAFIDFGHGIGNLLVMSAYSKGCHTRGIEVDEQRSTLYLFIRQTAI